MTSAPGARRGPRPWIFGLTAIPFGVGGGFTGVVMPFLLRQAGVPLDRITALTALALLPAAYQFLWAPIVDVGLRRRTWLVLLSALGAAATVAALLVPLPSGLDVFVPLAVASSALTSLISPCNGALVATTLPDGARGKAAGWLNAGNLGGGAIGAGVIMGLAPWAPRPLLAAVTGALLVLPALAVLAVDEDPRPRGRGAGAVFGAMRRDVWRTLRARSGWTGVLVCLSPVGTAALLNVFSGLGDDYRAAPSMVAFVNGYASGLVSAAGALAGGWICDRVDRRVAYLGAGALTAVVGLGMAAAPLAPSSYAVGVLVYLFVAGLCYAAFSAFIIEIVGAAGDSAATQYTLFSAAGNQAIAAVVWADGRGWKAWGPRGVLVTDALLNLAGIAVLVTLFATLARRRPVGGLAARPGGVAE